MPRVGLLSAAALALSCIETGCNKPAGQSSQPIEVARLAGGPHAPPAAATAPADEGNWVMPGKDYASTRFSGLNQITPANIRKGETMRGPTPSTLPPHGQIKNSDAAQ